MDRFLDATAELLEDRPFEEISVQDIVRRAGRSVGSFYGRFRDKDGVLLALAERVHRRRLALAREMFATSRWEGRSTAELLRTIGVVASELFSEPKNLNLALLGRAVSPGPFRELLVECLSEFVALWSEVILSRSKDLPFDEPEAEVRWAVTILLALSLDAVLLGSWQFCVSDASSSGERHAAPEALLGRLLCLDCRD
ncbi:MAG: hypothetical protein KatS3mg008_1446 [Acidimicrobiales bacterium]|nr:MAG: hypothetical protein KatS3mg008_1446 [Acidimicrobiales bacterium]